MIKELEGANVRAECGLNACVGVWRSSYTAAQARIADLEAALDKAKQRELTILGWLQDANTANQRTPDLLGQPRIPKNLNRASDQEVPNSKGG